MSETYNSPDINIGNNASRISESREFSASSTSCCWKIGVQKALNFSIVSLSGITTGTDFIPAPDISLKVEPEAIPSMVGNKNVSNRCSGTKQNCSGWHFGCTALVKS